MRRTARVSVLFLVAGVILLACSLFSVKIHNSTVGQAKAADGICTGTCHTHSPASAQASENKDEDDDKEPRPPLSSLLLSTVNLAALYVLPAALFLIFTNKFKRLYLTSHLRF